MKSKILGIPEIRGAAHQLKQGYRDVLDGYKDKILEQKDSITQYENDDKIPLKRAIPILFFSIVEIKGVRLYIHSSVTNIDHDMGSFEVAKNKYKFNSTSKEFICIDGPMKDKIYLNPKLYVGNYGRIFGNTFTGNTDNNRHRGLRDFLNFLLVAKNLQVTSLNIIQLDFATPFITETAAMNDKDVYGAYINNIINSKMIEFINENRFMIGHKAVEITVEEFYKNTGSTRTVKMMGEVDGGRDSMYARTYFGDKRKGPVDPLLPYFKPQFIPIDTNDIEFKTTDPPGSTVLLSEFLLFSTVVVGLNYLGSGLDIPLLHFRWGFENYGCPNRRKPSFHVDDMLVEHTPKPAFSRIIRTGFKKYECETLKHFYPNYKFYDHEKFCPPDNDE